MNTTRKAAIVCAGLTKRYTSGKETLTAVDGLDLSVAKGELYALLGVNGAGKTTTIKMLTGLIRPTEGDGSVAGYSIVREAAEARKHTGVSPQETAVAAKLTVRENLELMGGLYGAGRETRRLAAQVRDEMGLSQVITRRAGTLSGGWQRRLSIAMALMSRAEVLFLDEPTLGLDVLARRELWQEIGSLKGKVTVVLTTHYLEEAEALADRIGIMAQGRLLAEGTAAELKAKAGTDSFEEAFVRLVEGKCEA